MSYTFPLKGQTWPAVDELTERTLYRLSLDTHTRALAVRLLRKFRSMVGDLPASAEHPHSEADGLHRYSSEVTLHWV